LDKVELSADGAWAVTAGGSLRVWNVEDGREVCTLTEDALGVETVGIAANGKTVISAHGDKLHLWRVDPTLSLPKSSNYGDHFEQIDMAANGGRIVTATGNGRIEVWNGDSYSVVTSLAHGSEVSGVCVSSDGRWAVSSGSVLKLWDLDRGVEVRSFGDYVRKIRRTALSGDGRMVIGPGEELGALAAWNTGTGRLLFTLGDPTEEIGYVGLSKDGTRAVSAPWSKPLIKVWDLARRREIGQLKFHRDDVEELAISDDGRHLLSASRDGAIVH
jgi:WD40 repeat protein